MYYLAIEKKSAQGAALWWEAYQEALENVSMRPFAFGLAPENQCVEYELRQVLFKTRYGRTYRGVFTVVHDQVRILRIRGLGQPPLLQDEIAG